MSQAILACILLSLIQLIGVLFILAFGFGVNMQGKLAEIAAFLSVYALVAVAFGLVISSLAKTPIQGNILGVIMVPVISMLGGAWFPTEVFPDFLRKASQLVPVSWAVSGVDKLLAGGTLASLGQHTLILLLFAAVFFLLGTWKRADVAR